MNCLVCIQDMDRALGDAIIKINFTPFHRDKHDTKRTKKVWARCCGMEPYDVEEAQRTQTMSSAGNGHQDSLFSFDMMAAIQRQQSFPFQVKPN